MRTLTKSIILNVSLVMLTASTAALAAGPHRNNSMSGAMPPQQMPTQAAAQATIANTQGAAAAMGNLPSAAQAQAGMGMTNSQGAAQAGMGMANPQAATQASRSQRNGMRRDQH